MQVPTIVLTPVLVTTSARAGSQGPGEAVRLFSLIDGHFSIVGRSQAHRLPIRRWTPRRCPPVGVPQSISLRVRFSNRQPAGWRRPMSRHWWSTSVRQLVDRRILTEDCLLGRGRRSGTIWTHLKRQNCRLPFLKLSWNAWTVAGHSRTIRTGPVALLTRINAISGPSTASLSAQPSHARERRFSRHRESTVET